MDTKKILIPKVYQCLFEEGHNLYCISGGRLSGKTKTISLISILLLEMYGGDGIVVRASAQDFRESIYAELQDIINDYPQITESYESRLRPMQIRKKDMSSVVYFKGAGGSNTSRTKGLKTTNNVTFVIFEETQELPSRDNLEQALASFRRRFGNNVKVFVLFNPESNPAHWLNEWHEEKKQDPSWKCLHTTWEDIRPFLNKFDIEAIEYMRENKYDYYQWLYGGIPVGAFKSIYPMYNTFKHTISERVFINALFDIGLNSIVIGGDGAVTHDATTFTAIAILKNGQSIAFNHFRHDPKISGVIGTNRLVTQYLYQWLNDVFSDVRIGNINSRNPSIPIFMVIDNASTDLIIECRTSFSHTLQVLSTGTKNIQNIVEINQSVLDSNLGFIVERGYRKDYVNGTTIQETINILSKEIMSLEWDETQTKYNKHIPNDSVDSWGYANRYWYSKPENMHKYNLINSNNNNRIDIETIIRKEQ